MAETFRIIDTGVREGRANIAFDAALIEERQAGRVPDTIRFLRFPPTALIGRHQDLSREVNLDFCADNGIGIAPETVHRAFDRYFAETMPGTNKK